jgi:hypothetical protein
MSDLNLSDTLIEVWRQALVEKASAVKLGSGSYSVTQSKAKRLRQVEFVFEGNMIIGIQQIRRRDRDGLKWRGWENR